MTSPIRSQPALTAAAASRREYLTLQDRCAGDAEEGDLGIVRQRQRGVAGRRDGVVQPVLPPDGHGARVTM
jgi:hypothetical protein